VTDDPESLPNSSEITDGDEVAVMASSNMTSEIRREKFLASRASSALAGFVRVGYAALLVGWTAPAHIRRNSSHNAASTPRLTGKSSQEVRRDKGRGKSFRGRILSNIEV